MMNTNNMMNNIRSNLHNTINNIPDNLLIIGTAVKGFKAFSSIFVWKSSKHVCYEDFKNENVFSYKRFQACYGDVFAWKNIYFFKNGCL